jgi:hypothetical protein
VRLGQKQLTVAYGQAVIRHSQSLGTGTDKRAISHLQPELSAWSCDITILAEGLRRLAFRHDYEVPRARFRGSQFSRHPTMLAPVIVIRESREPR